MARFDLDVDSPEQIAPVLESAAEEFSADAIELESAHQDTTAGKPWTIVADELNKAAERIGKRLKKMGY